VFVMDNRFLNRMVWNIIQSDDKFAISLMSEVERNEYINHIDMPYKGCGNIQVQESDMGDAVKLLEVYVGSYEFNKSYVNGFITDKVPSEEFYYGKFEIENLPDFIRLLIKNRIKIIDIHLT